MRYLLVLMFIFTSGCGNAMDVGQVFESYLWQKRVVLVFTPSDRDENYREQIHIFESIKDGMVERDLVQWVIIDNTRVTKEGAVLPQVGTPKLYRHFNVPAQKFTVILLGKDGEEKLREQSALTSDALFSLIDAMPMRQQEVREN